jgi:dethiobiotin synthase
VARGLFVTGTDTGVGKTVVSAALMCLYRERAPVRYWKPIQTGIEQDDDTGNVMRLAGCVPGEVWNEGVRLPRPVSPHLAAHSAGQPISLEALADLWASADVGAVADVGAAFRRPEAFWIVEGAGGVLVPLNDEHAVIDLIVRLALPALVVARTTLGTINQTLLTLDALKSRQVPVAGVVMVGAPDLGAREAIERRGRTIVAEMPALNPLTPAAVASWAAEASGSWRI